MLEKKTKVFCPYKTCDQEISNEIIISLVSPMNNILAKILIIDENTKKPNEVASEGIFKYLTSSKGVMERRKTLNSMFSRYTKL